jgi:acyl-CoA synthetase (AMP-forming)/AMP-acid ligase II
VSTTGAVFSYARLAASTATVTAWLAERVEPSGVVAVVAGNGPEAVPVLLAAGSAAICAPLPAGRTGDERVAQLERLAPQALLVTADAGTPEDETAATRLGIPVVRLPGDGDFTDLPPLRALRRGCAAPAGTALLIHTSGSTGAGKLVPLTASGLEYAAGLVAQTLGLSTADRCLNVLPLHHTHGLVGAVLSSLCAGGSVVCLPGYADDAVTVALTALAPTWYTAVPAIHARIAALASAGWLDGHRLRFARSASAPLTGPLLHRLRASLGVPVLQAYALTEAPGQICAHRPDDTVHSGSVGRAYGCEVMVLDEAERSAVDSVGAIAVRGAHVSPGYLRSVDGGLVSHVDGWLRTGDLGRLTADGELFLVGRADDVINRAGEKVVPEEVEEVLASYPDVDDVVVFGLPDPVLGEQIVALVTGTTDTDAVHRHAQRVLSTGRLPDRIVPVEQIPRTATGKVNRRHLSHLIPPEKATPDRVDAVAEIWSHVLFLPEVDPDADFTEMGGGSLQGARIEALVAERFGVDLPPAAVLDQGSTVRRMAELIGLAAS